LAVVAPRSAATKSAITELVEQHLSLVDILVAERLRNVPVHVRRDDLVSAGMLALVVSAGAYDPQRGVPFQGFAAFRIRGALIDELRAMDWASRSVRCRAREVETIRTRLTMTMDRQPGSDEIADALGISIRELDGVYAELSRATVVSLQGLVTDAPCDTPANRAECPESLILHRERMGYLHDAISALPERLRYVVVAYYLEQRQMVDIAVDLSVTQSRVSQMCAEAITLIRDGMNSQLDPDAMRPLARTGRAGATRLAYYQAIADRNDAASRLEMSTSQGEMRPGVHVEHVRAARRQIA
jgi:RNA polymerase sigma factor for flagellar operon FliA